MKALADILDLIHGPAFASLLLLNFFPATERLGAYIWAIIISLQAICEGCPLTLVTCNMRGDMSRFEASLTHRLYRKYGPMFGIAFWIVLTAGGYLWCRWRMAQL